MVTHVTLMYDDLPIASAERAEIEFIKFFSLWWWRWRTLKIFISLFKADRDMVFTPKCGVYNVVLSIKNSSQWGKYVRRYNERKVKKYWENWHFFYAFCKYRKFPFFFTNFTFFFNFISAFKLDKNVQLSQECSVWNVVSLIKNWLAVVGWINSKK